jgi:DNA mismatch repair protein MutS2
MVHIEGVFAMDSTRCAFPMPERTLKDLEFHYVMNDLQRFCRSSEGRQLLQNQGFYRTRDELDRQLNYVDEMLELREKSGRWMEEEFPDIREALHRAAAEGGAADGEQLYSLYLYLCAADSLKEYICNSEDCIPKQTAVLIGSMPDVSRTRELLGSALEGPGRVKETHPRIAPLIRELENARRERGLAAQSYLSGQPDAMRQDQAVVRDGRIVLPVKSSARSSLAGIIHGSSGSGATLFIEPLDLVDRNNRVAWAEQRIAVEIRAVLKELTAEVRSVLPQIEAVSETVGAVDAFSAKARYSRSRSCTRAQGCERGLELKKARHPLLGSMAVPIDIELAPEKRALIMSGPNAGGKTVTLKTIGLLALMNQYGLFIPAEEGSSLMLFGSVLTDIGDEQSIAASLSTFSGHMKHISEIMRTADSISDSLVILDELGSGTDPSEGAALARAVLEYSCERAALTFITSHHSVLKHYAYGSKTILNASMEFDDALKTPTFRVIPGLPGDSYAIETARRMEMPPEVIDKACSYLSDESVRISTVIKALEQKRKEQELLEQQLRDREEQIINKGRMYDLKLLKLRQDEALLKQKQLSGLDSFAAEARRELENLVRELKEKGADRERTVKVKEYISGLDAEIQKKSRQVKQAETYIQAPSGEEPTEGASVRVSPGGKIGTVVRQSRPGFWVVALGSMKITFAQKDLQVVVQENPEKMHRSGSRVRYSLESETSGASMPVLTLDVRGMTLQEARLELEKQLDRAIVHGMTSFSVIHGKGDGILQRGLHEYLRSSPVVRSFEFAGPQESGYGKTYVFLTD